MTATHNHVLAIVCSPACPAWAQTVDDMPGLTDDQRARDHGLMEGEPSPRMTDPTPESRLLIPEEYTRAIHAAFWAPSPLEALIPDVPPAPVSRVTGDVSREDAIARLLELAKDRIGTIDGEWGCCHGYGEALEEPSCMMHEEAAEVRLLEAALGEGESS